MTYSKDIAPIFQKNCVACHQQETPGIIDHWKGSTHARKAIGCVECHQAEKGDADAFDHYGALIATVVTPRDCARCHAEVTAELIPPEDWPFARLAGTDAAGRHSLLITTLQQCCTETQQLSDEIGRHLFAHVGSVYRRVWQ